MDFQVRDLEQLLPNKTRQATTVSPDVENRKGKMSAEMALKATTGIVAVCGLVFGIVKFMQIQQIEASRPYLEKKLEWCEEAVEMASSVANAKDGADAEEQRFWELYWGVMGLVENEQVTKAMVEFGDELQANRNLKAKALAIAHACRLEMSRDWSSSWAR